MRVLLRNFFVRCTACCFRALLPVLLQHGGTAGGRALHRLPGMPAWAACCTTSCCTAALHRLVGWVRSVAGTPVAADRASGYVPRPEEPEDHLVFEEFAVVRLVSTAGTGPRHCWRRGCAAPSLRGPSRLRGRLPLQRDTPAAAHRVRTRFNRPVPGTTSRQLVVSPSLPAPVCGEPGTQFWARAGQRPGPVQRAWAVSPSGRPPGEAVRVPGRPRTTSPAARPVPTVRPGGATAQSISTRKI